MISKQFFTNHFPYGVNRNRKELDMPLENEPLFSLFLSFFFSFLSLPMKEHFGMFSSSLF